MHCPPYQHRAGCDPKIPMNSIHLSQSYKQQRTPPGGGNAGCSSPSVHTGCSERAGSCLDKVSDICKQWVSAGPGPGYLEQGSQLSFPKCLNGGPQVSIPAAPTLPPPTANTAWLCVCRTDRQADRHKPSRCQDEGFRAALCRTASSPGCCFMPHIDSSIPPSNGPTEAEARHARGTKQHSMPTTCLGVQKTSASDRFTLTGREPGWPM